MGQNNELSPEEISKAATLADRLLDQDVERKSAIDAAAEIGIPATYLQKAATEIQREKANRQEAALRRRRVATAAAIIIITAVAVNLIVWRNTVAATSRENAENVRISRLKVGRPTVPDAFPDLPAAQMTSVNLVPVASNVPITLKAVSGEHPVRTYIRFRNDSNRPVNANEVGSTGGVTFRYTLAPGEVHKQITYFGTPWVITDRGGNNIGVFFPTSTPSTASIPDGAVLSSLAGDETNLDRAVIDFGSFLKPLTADTADRASGSTGPKSMIEFVNMRTSVVDVYRTGIDGSQSSEQRLGPGENVGVETTMSDTWFVVDEQHALLYRFRADPVARTAIIWPKDEQ